MRWNSKALSLFCLKEIRFCQNVRWDAQKLYFLWSTMEGKSDDILYSSRKPSAGSKGLAPLGLAGYLPLFGTCPEGTLARALAHALK